MELNLRKQKKSEINSDRLSNPRPAMWILKQFVPKSIGIILQPFLPRDATQARPICRHAVSVCLSVCHVRELCQNVSSIFLPSISHAILVFHAKQHSNIPTGTPLTGASNAGVVGRNRDSEPTYIHTYTHTYITICIARCVDSTEYMSNQRRLTACVNAAIG